MEMHDVKGTKNKLQKKLKNPLSVPQTVIDQIDHHSNAFSLCTPVRAQGYSRQWYSCNIYLRVHKKRTISESSLCMITHDYMGLILGHFA